MSATRSSSETVTTETSTSSAAAAAAASTSAPQTAAASGQRQHLERGAEARAESIAAQGAPREQPLPGGGNVTSITLPASNDAAGVVDWVRGPGGGWAKNRASTAAATAAASGASGGTGATDGAGPGAVVATMEDLLGVVSAQASVMKAYQRQLDQVRIASLRLLRNTPFHDGFAVAESA